MTMIRTKARRRSGCSSSTTTPSSATDCRACSPGIRISRWWGRPGTAADAVSQAEGLPTGRRADGSADAGDGRRGGDQAHGGAWPRGQGAGAHDVRHRGRRTAGASRPARRATCSRTRRRQELYRAVRAAAAGEAVLSPPVASRLMGQMRAGRPGVAERARDGDPRLSSPAARRNREVAARLFISEATVKTHLLHLYGKLGVNDRSGRGRRRVCAGAPTRDDGPA